LAKTKPGVALCMAVFMVSLAGLPPTAGFFAKFVVFRDAVSQGFILAVVLGILASVASLYYYLRVVVAMYMAAPESVNAKEGAPPAYEYSWSLAALIYLAGIGTLVGCLLPGLIVQIWPK
jgi:NADH-quinone oxidoreductase subunit N